jgi:gas vesicle protein
LHFKEKMMTRKSRRNVKKSGVGKVIIGVLMGGMVGATLGWLTSPASGAEIRRRLRRSGIDARERAKTAIGNVESRARNLAQEISQYGDEMTETDLSRQQS